MSAAESRGNCGEETARPDSQAQESQDGQMRHQRKRRQQQQEQQHSRLYTFELPVAERAPQGDINPGIASIVDTVALTFELADFDFHDFHIQPATPELGDFQQLAAVGGTESPRAIPENSLQSSMAPFHTPNSNLWGWTAAHNPLLDGLALSSTSLAFPDNILGSRNGFGPSMSVSSENNTSDEATPELQAVSKRTNSLPQLNSHASATLNPAARSFLPQQQSNESASQVKMARGRLQPTNRSSQNSECSGECTKTLSEMLARLDECHTGGDDYEVSLDTLLGLDRELHQTTKRTLTCRRCMEKPSGQTGIMLAIMAQGNLLGLFERQQDVATKESAPLRDMRRTGNQQQQPQQQQNQFGLGCSVSSQFPWTDKSLLVGNFTVNDEVKAVFLRQLLLIYVENLGSILSELGRNADLVLKDVNRKISKEMVADIYRRASFLRGKLWLAG
ncbi:hypothetical protein QBC46DRAFT_410191 [Diplogelasinospora grovesii]|uniref:Uncharacterized protein n=1 Tax=Diplogelasinospora grovesii TaxID=303347 RepID=A0AAN6S3C1_9PEZI|nr:hypothetical protein QBC46DRAFT_410191 [Diplogelasinospora grovesii]